MDYKEREGLWIVRKTDHYTMEQKVTVLDNEADAESLVANLMTTSLSNLKSIHHVSLDKSGTIKKYVPAIKNMKLVLEKEDKVEVGS